MWVDFPEMKGKATARFYDVYQEGDGERLRRR
jgi:hypothetical protein